MTKLAYRQAAHAVAAHKLGLRFESVDLEAGMATIADHRVDPAAREERRLAQDEATILTVGALVGGETPPLDDWAQARAARLVRRYDFLPMVTEVAAALESRGCLAFTHVDDLVRSVRRRLDIVAMDDHPVAAAAS